MPSVGQGALDKEFFFKKNKKSLPSAYRVGTRQSDRQRGRRHDSRFFCRGPDRGHSTKNFFLKKNKKSLPTQSDRQRGRRRDGRFSLPSAPRALGKAFAECPIKDTRQRGLCRSIFCRVFFAKCRTRQRLCRVQFSLYRVPRGHSVKKSDRHGAALVDGHFAECQPCRHSAKIFLFF